MKHKQLVVALALSLTQYSVAAESKKKETFIQFFKRNGFKILGLGVVLSAALYYVYAEQKRKVGHDRIEYAQPSSPNYERLSSQAQDGYRVLQHALQSGKSPLRKKREGGITIIDGLEKEKYCAFLTEQRGMLFDQFLAENENEVIESISSVITPREGKVLLALLRNADSEDQKAQELMRRVVIKFGKRMNEQWITALEKTFGILPYA